MLHLLCHGGCDDASLRASEQSHPMPPLVFIDTTYSIDGMCHMKVDLTLKPAVYYTHDVIVNTLASHISWVSAQAAML